MKNKIALIVTCSVLGLSACSVGPNYQKPQNSFLDQWFGSGADVSSQEPINTQWWQAFNDPLLTDYIEQAAENNKDVQVAIANIKRARALRRATTAGFLPSVDANGQAQRSQASAAGFSSTGSSGSIRTVYDAGFDASWELDLFGGTRRDYEAADARYGAAIESYHDVMLTTFAEVARNYYEARGLQKRIAYTEQNAELLKKTFGLIEKRLEVGEATNFDATRARGEYQATLARLPNLKGDLEASIFTLSVLLGLPPESLLDEMQQVQPLPTPPDIVPVGLRSDLLRRRPDVRMAERELASSSADIGVETAELFPKFFITGDIGSQARLFGDLFTSAAGLWSFGSVMQWSVFNGGAIHARIDAAKAQNEAALASYQKTVLEALGDTETSLTRYGREIETRNQLEESAQSRREAVRLAQQLLDAGESDYLSVLDSQRELISSEDSLVVSETATITKLIALYTALGGGWEAVEE